MSYTPDLMISVQLSDWEALKGERDEWRETAHSLAAEVARLAQENEESTAIRVVRERDRFRKALKDIVAMTDRLHPAAYFGNCVAIAELALQKTDDN